MIVTNTITSAAYKGKGVIVTIDPSVQNDRESISWFYPGMQVKSEASGDKGIVAWVDRKGTKFCVMPIQPNKKFEGSASNKLKASDTIYFDENRIGNLIWKLEYLDQTSMGSSGDLITEVTTNATWASSYDSYPMFSYPLNDPLKKSEGVIYNRRALKDPSFCPPGWRLVRMDDLVDLWNATGTGNITTFGASKFLDNIGQYKATPGSPYAFQLPNVGAQNPTFKNFNATPKYLRSAGQGYAFNQFISGAYSWMAIGLTYQSLFSTNKVATRNNSVFYFTNSQQRILVLDTTISGYCVRLVRNFNSSAGIS